MEDQTPDKAFMRMISANYGIIYTVLNEDIPMQWRADVQQDILAEAWTAWPAFRGDSKPSTWLYKISLYTCIEWKRKARQQAAAVYIESASTPTDWLERLEAMLPRIKALDLDLLLLKYVVGLREARISQLTGIGQGAMRKRLYDIKKRIKNTSHEY